MWLASSVHAIANIHHAVGLLHDEKRTQNPIALFTPGLRPELVKKTKQNNALDTTMKPFSATPNAKPIE